jgi:predicted nucleotidyltransferase
MRELPEIFKILYDASLEFVVIGGAAMHLQGSAYVTKDVDFCYSRTPDNMKRLATSLAPYHPRLRGAPADLPFTFDARTIAQGMNFTLTTDLGDLDFLGEVTGLGGYKEVKAAADMQIIDGIPVLVLSLSGLIKSKKAAGRAKDLYVLPELEGLELLKRKTGAE